MTKLAKYKKNLRIDGNRVISYATVVATIDLENGTLTEIGKWSQTTTKHVNYVAAQLGLRKIAAK